jgi:hypothetical protein
LQLDQTLGNQVFLRRPCRCVGASCMFPPWPKWSCGRLSGSTAVPDVTGFTQMGGGLPTSPASPAAQRGAGAGDPDPSRCSTSGRREDPGLPSTHWRPVVEKHLPPTPAPCPLLPSMPLRPTAKDLPASFGRIPGLHLGRLFIMEQHFLGTLCEFYLLQNSPFSAHERA